MSEPDAVGYAEYRRCGDHLTMFFRVQEDVIKDVCFDARACGPVTAAASFATTYLFGKTVAQARELDAFQLSEALGGLPTSKRHALLLVLQCLAEALGPRLLQNS